MMKVIGCEEGIRRVGKRLIYIILKIEDGKATKSYYIILYYIQWMGMGMGERVCIPVLFDTRWLVLLPLPRGSSLWGVGSGGGGGGGWGVGWIESEVRREWGWGGKEER